MVLVSSMLLSTTEKLKDKERLSKSHETARGLGRGTEETWIVSILYSPSFSFSLSLPLSLSLPSSHYLSLCLSLSLSLSLSRCILRVSWQSVKSFESESVPSSFFPKSVHLTVRQCLKVYLLQFIQACDEMQLGFLLLYFAAVKVTPDVQQSPPCLTACRRCRRRDQIK
jgi:hypothetical protein